MELVGDNEVTVNQRVQARPFCSAHLLHLL